MIDFETSKKQIASLVEEFKTNEHIYKTVAFDEENTKINFINKFFQALGWDVTNEAGVAPQFKDVEFEDTVIVGGKPKAPDYCFRIGGARIFFVEAKKPSVDIEHDRRYAFQLKRYTWSAHLPLGILTDFEELAIYEPKTAPKKTHNTSVDRIKYYHYTEYVDNWEEIFNIFSKEAVLTGKFDQYVKNIHGDKKGTSTVDSEFLKTIEEWRLELAKNIALRNKELTVDELNYAVQLIIDRIIFLRIAEDRGIEKYGQLKKLTDLAINEKDKCPVYEGFIELCRKADAKYNSGLFHFTEEKDISLSADTLTPTLHVDDGKLKKIIDGLYYPDCPYEFSMISTEILGNIYEQFLGKVIRLTEGHQAKVEDKPEVKKAGGVFYTPQYIVNYIVENTVGELLKGKTPNKVSELRIVDPACGSGSFLLGAYQKLLDWHVEYYSNLDQPPKNVIYIGKDGIPRLTIQEKKRILLNNIYGVDIDSQAVEVTKLSLLLKVLEDENKDVLEAQQKLIQERALPYLGDNIRCGNSLIGTDILDSNDLSSEELHDINPFDWEDEFSEIFKNGGFDAVIGNPPYVRQERLMNLKQYLKEKYDSFNGKADMYVYFFEKGTGILKQNGKLSYISSNKFLKSNYGKKLRILLLNSLNFDKYYDLTNEDVFSGATTYTSVFILSKRHVKGNKILIDEDYYFSQNELDDNFWLFYPEEISNLRKKIESKGEFIKNFEDINIFYGIKTGLNKAFFIDEATKENLINEDDKNSKIIKPLVVGKNIKPWFIDYNNQYLIYTERGININNYPSIKNYLGNYKKELTPRNNGQKVGRAKGNYKWFELQSGGSNKELLENPKLIYPEIANKLFVTYDDKGYYPNAKCFVITSEHINLKYLSAILSSKLINFYFKFLATPLRGNYYNLSKIYVEKIPLVLSESKQQQIIELADKMLELNRNLTNCKTPKDEKILKLQINKTNEKIDKLVYELYGLTDEEISIVENEVGNEY